MFGLHAKSLSEAQTLSDAIKSMHGTCSGNVVDKRCTDLAGKASSADTLGNASTAAFAIGGAAAVGAAVYLLWPEAPAAPVRVAPAVGAGQGGLIFSGSF